MVKSTLYDLTDNHDLVRKAAYMEHRLDNLPNPGILVFIKELHDEIINHSQNFLKTTDNPVISTNWTFKGVLRSYLPASTDYDVVNLKSLNQTYLGSLRLNAEEMQTVAGPVKYLSDNVYEGPVIFKNTVQRYHDQAGPYNVIDASTHTLFEEYPKYTKQDYKVKEPADNEFTPYWWAKGNLDPEKSNTFTERQFIDAHNFDKIGTYDTESHEYAFVPPIIAAEGNKAYSSFVTLYDLHKLGVKDLSDQFQVIPKDEESIFNENDKNEQKIANSMELIKNKEEQQNTNPILLTLDADYDLSGSPSLRVGTQKIEVVGDDYKFTPGHYEAVAYLGRETWTTGLHIAPTLEDKNSQVAVISTSYTPTPQSEGEGGASQFDLSTNFMMYPTGKVLNKSTGEIETFDTSFIANTNALFVIGGNKAFNVAGGGTTHIPLFAISPIIGGYSIEHYAPANFSSLVRVAYPAAGKSFSVGRQDGALYNEYFAVGSTAIETNRPIVAKLGDATVLNIESRTIDTDTYPVAEINGGVIVNCLSDVDGPLFRVEYTTEEGSQTITHPIIYSSKEENLIYNNLAVMDGETELFSTFPLQTYVGTPMVVAGAMEVSPDVVDSEEYEPVVIVDVVDDDDIIDLATISHNHSLNRSLTVLQTELSIKDYSGNDLSTFSLVEDGWVHKLNCDSHYTVGAPDEGNTEIVAKWYLTQELGSYAKSADVAESYATKEELASYYTKTESDSLYATKTEINNFYKIDSSEAQYLRHPILITKETGSSPATSIELSAASGSGVSDQRLYLTGYGATEGDQTSLYFTISNDVPYIWSHFVRASQSMDVRKAVVSPMSAITTIEYDNQSNLPTEFLNRLGDPQLFLRRTNSTENGEIMLKDQLIMKYDNEETLIREFNINVTKQYEQYLQETTA